jgi:hypothetical protein
MTRSRRMILGWNMPVERDSWICFTVEFVSFTIKFVSIPVISYNTSASIFVVE